MLKKVEGVEDVAKVEHFPSPVLWALAGKSREDLVGDFIRSVVLAKTALRGV